MMEHTKILLVEDDNNLGQLLKDYLEIKGFSTALCKDGEEGWKTFQNYPFDFCILDVMLPKLDGFRLAERIRQNDSKTPILFLTAKSMKEDTIQGLKIGADDYMTKPFRMEELILRVQAILRRTAHSIIESEEQFNFQIGKFTFEFDKQLLINPQTEQVQHLTSKEAQLLKMLCESKNQTLNRSIALKSIWQNDTYFTSRSMDVYITKLRKYLKSDESLQIVNVHGQGFKLLEV